MSSGRTERDGITQKSQFDAHKNQVSTWLARACADAGIGATELSRRCGVSTSLAAKWLDPEHTTSVPAQALIMSGDVGLVVLSNMADSHGQMLATVPTAGTVIDDMMSSVEVTQGGAELAGVIFKAIADDYIDPTEARNIITVGRRCLKMVASIVARAEDVERKRGAKVSRLPAPPKAGGEG